MGRMVVSVSLLWMVACNGGDTSPADDCSSCGDDELCLTYLGGDDDREECAPIPAECGGAVDCTDTPCVGAAYDLCDEGWMAVGCSDTFPPVLISCNPDA